MLIAYHEIIYIDSFSRTPHIHLSNGLIKTENKLSEIFELLKGKPQFLNCKKDVLVNMDHISHVLDNEFVLSNNEKISIRQRAKNSVKNTYLKYTLRELYSKES